MSEIKLVIDERHANIGRFTVGRLLPFRAKRLIGPFIYLDHMGPAFMSEEENFDVLPHPHIGLSTLTYLLEGSIMHRDSLGSLKEIKPGEVNWMTAGKGIVHSERTPDLLRRESKKLHGIQIWIALPKEFEQTEPSFTHIVASEIPDWEVGDSRFKLIAGEVMGRKSPVPVFSRLYLLEISSNKRRTLSFGDSFYGEYGIYIFEGSVQTGGRTYLKGKILVFENSPLHEIELEENSRIFILGGDPFPEERFISWNFVSSDRELIEQAKNDWRDQKFPAVPGETEYVPLPGK